LNELQQRLAEATTRPDTHNQGQQCEFYSSAIEQLDKQLSSLKKETAAAVARFDEVQLAFTLLHCKCEAAIRARADENIRSDLDHMHASTLQLAVLSAHEQEMVAAADLQKVQGGYQWTGSESVLDYEFLIDHDQDHHAISAPEQLVFKVQTNYLPSPAPGKPVRAVEAPPPTPPVSVADNLAATTLQHAMEHAQNRLALEMTAAGYAWPLPSPAKGDRASIRKYVSKSARDAGRLKTELVTTLRVLGNAFEAPLSKHDDEDYEQTLFEAFTLYDVDGSGRISRAEFFSLMEHEFVDKIGVKRALEEIEVWVNEKISDESAELNFDSFVVLYKEATTKFVGLSTERGLVECFNTIDSDRTGVISRSELLKLCDVMTLPASAAESRSDMQAWVLQAALQADLNQDGLSFNEFRQVYQQAMEKFGLLHISKLHEKFIQFDADHSGSISKAEFVKLFDTAFVQLDGLSSARKDIMSWVDEHFKAKEDTHFKRNEAGLDWDHFVLMFNAATKEFGARKTVAESASHLVTPQLASTVIDELLEAQRCLLNELGPDSTARQLRYK
jgi:Ca2+-binding EF-hand superfamily protein